MVTFKGAFHGRTLATIASAGNAKHLEGFGQPADGFDMVPFGDLAAAEAAIGPHTAGIMVEPVQGEGGVHVASNAWLKALRELCDRHGLLLVLDEVQTGMGRTGKLFAHEWAGITPDIMAVAKGLGGGFPVGAVLATDDAAKGMVAGTHGSTFGGNPLAMAVGSAVLEAVLEPGFLDHVQAMALRFKQQLARLKDEHPRSHRGGARQRPAARHQGQAADGRCGRCLRRREAADGRRRRQRGAPAGAAQRHRGGDRRGGAPPAASAGAPGPSRLSFRLREAQRHGAHGIFSTSTASTPAPCGASSTWRAP